MTVRRTVRESAAPGAPTVSEQLEGRLLLATASLVRDLNAVSAGASISVLVDAGAFAYFAANDGVHGRELWKTDGTAAGTALVGDIRPGTERAIDGPMAVLNGTVLF